jgi:hypothetical protein
MARKPKAAITAAERAPLCKICEPPRRHWSREPHKFPKKKGKVTRLA